MSEKRKAIISDTLKYASSQYISQFLGFFTATLMRRFINPYGMGVWGLIKVILDYAGYAYLGVTNILFYKYPYLIGKGENKEAEEIKDAVFSFVSIVSITISAGVASFALIYKNNLDKTVFFGLLATALLIFLQRVYTYCIMLLRAQKNFSILSKSVIFDAVTNLFLVIILVGKFKLYGLFAAVILMPILNVLYMRWQIDYNFKYRLIFKELSSYIKFGFPLFLSDILTGLLNSVDKIMIASMLGLQSLGFYSIALMAKSYSVGISKNFVIVIAPHFLEDFGKTNDIQKTSKYMTVGSFVLSYFMSFLLGAVFIVTTPFIFYILPKFMPGLFAMRVYLIVTFFAALSNIPSYFIVALNKQMSLVPIICVALLMNITLNFIFIKIGWGISGAAMATAIASLFSFLALAVYVMRHFENLNGIIRFFLRLAFPALYSICVLYILNLIIKVNNMLLISIIQLVLFTAAFIPLALYANSKTRILNTIWAMLLAKFKKGENSV